MQAALVIDQADVDLIAKGGKTVIKLDELPGDVFYSDIASISQIPLTAAPRELSHKSGGDLQTKTDASGVERPENTSYEALAPIDDPRSALGRRPARPRQNLLRPLDKSRHPRLASVQPDVSFQAVSGRRSEVGGRRSEVGGRRSEVRGQRTREAEAVCCWNFFVLCPSYLPLPRAQQRRGDCAPRPLREWVVTSTRKRSSCATAARRSWQVFVFSALHNPYAAKGP